MKPSLPNEPIDWRTSTLPTLPKRLGYSSAKARELTMEMASTAKNMVNHFHTTEPPKHERFSLEKTVLRRAAIASDLKEPLPSSGTTLMKMMNDCRIPKVAQTPIATKCAPSGAEGFGVIEERFQKTKSHQQQKAHDELQKATLYDRKPTPTAKDIVEIELALQGQQQEEQMMVSGMPPRASTTMGMVQPHVFEGAYLDGFGAPAVEEIGDDDEVNSLRGSAPHRRSSSSVRAATSMDGHRPTRRKSSFYITSPEGVQVGELSPTTNQRVTKRGCSDRLANQTPDGHGLEHHSPATEQHASRPLSRMDVLMERLSAPKETDLEAHWKVINGKRDRLLHEMNATMSNHASCPPSRQAVRSRGSMESSGLLSPTATFGTTSSTTTGCYSPVSQLERARLAVAFTQNPDYVWLTDNTAEWAEQKLRSSEDDVLTRVVLGSSDDVGATLSDDDFHSSSAAAAFVVKDQDLAQVDPEEQQRRLCALRVVNDIDRRAHDITTRRLMTPEPLQACLAPPLQEPTPARYSPFEDTSKIRHTSKPSRKDIMKKKVVIAKSKGRVDPIEEGRARRRLQQAEKDAHPTRRLQRVRQMATPAPKQQKPTIKSFEEKRQKDKQERDRIAAVNEDAKVVHLPVFQFSTALV